MPSKKNPLEKIFGTLKKAVEGVPANKPSENVAKKPSKKVTKKAAKSVTKASKKSAKVATKKSVKKATKKVAVKQIAKKSPAKKTSKTAVKKPVKKVVKKLVKKFPAKQAPVKKVAKKVPAKVAKKTPKKVAVKKAPSKAAAKTPVVRVAKPSLPKAPKKPKGYVEKKKLDSLGIANLREHEWLPERSKIKAAIVNGLQESYFNVRRMLYIGAAHGYTVSHIHEKPIELYAVEKSREMMQYFLPLAEDLPTVIPIYADAAKPDSYANLIPHQVDLVFQDIAQRDQVGIFLANCNLFLSPQGVGILCLKAKNVDSTAEPSAVFADARQKLEREGATIVQEINLEPYQKHHRVFVVHLNPYHDW